MNYLKEAANIAKRWAPSPLDRYDEPATKVLLENQRLINQAAPAKPAEFKRISIPLVRRIYPQLIANKIVSVQPLLGPTALTYYLRYRYSQNKGQFNPFLSVSTTLELD